MAQLNELTLPKRFEKLEQQNSTKAVDLQAIVQRVDSAAARLETLLRQVQSGGLGRFEVFFGKSGSGKTTFFKTLGQFFTGTEVIPIPSNIPLTMVADYVLNKTGAYGERQVWVLYDRDNEAIDMHAAKQFFETLRVLFRRPEGTVVICWPLTEQITARTLSDAAWEIGRESVVDVETKGWYPFAGPPKNTYFKIADLTVKTLRGDGLDSFGITESKLADALAQSETIAEFFARVEAVAAQINSYYKDILKNKVIPQIWILVAGDDAQKLNLTVATLTQGTEKAVDIDRVIEFLDQPEQDTAYLAEWKKRRSAAGYLLRLLDVRLFELSPNVALAAVRGFGSEESRSVLKTKKTSEKLAVESISRSAFYRALVNEDLGASGYLRATEPETRDEYLRLQVSSRGEDKRLNKALAGAILTALQGQGISAEVTAEKQNPDDVLKPDIKVTYPDGRVICLEPTWRTTGTGVEGEFRGGGQNTYTTGHIQKYLLEKILGYVYALGL